MTETRPDWQLKGMIFALSLGSMAFLYQPFMVNSDYALWILATWISAWSLILLSTKPKTMALLGWLSVVLLSLDLWMQSVYFRGFQMYGRLGTAFSMQADVTAYSSSIQEFIAPQDWRYILTPALAGLALLMLSRIKTVNNPTPWIKTGVRLALGFILCFSLFQFNQRLNASTEATSLFDPVSDAQIYHDVRSTVQFVNHFGLIGLLQRDLSNLVYEPILINAADQKSVLSTWLASLPQYKTSDFFGVAAQQNVLVIQAESLMNLAIDPVLTPNLFRLTQEGVVASGYDAPLMYGSTADTEFMANTSLVPPNNGLVAFIRYSDHRYPTTLAKVFSKAGYTSLAYHNNVGSFYHRSEMLPNLGYTFYDSTALGFDEEAVGDVTIAQKIVETLPQNPFFIYWTSMEGHQPYGLEGLPEQTSSMLPLVQTRYPNLTESEQVYLAKAMIFDQALGVLIDGLKAQNRLDQTLIVVMGDHAAKGVYTQDDEVAKVSGASNAHATPMIFWSTKLKAMVLDKPTTALDLAPTLFDLCGIQVETVTLGQSLFNPHYEGFNFNQWGDLKLGTLTYHALQKTIEVPEGLSDADASEMVMDAKTFLNNAALLVELDYFESPAP